MTSSQAPSGNPALLFVSALAAFVATFDMNAVNLALPKIGEDFPGGASSLAWVVNAYVVPFAVSILIIGRIGDSYGRRKVMVGGALLFAIASLGSALTPNFEILIASRVFQGIGGSALAITSLALVMASYPPPARAKAMGLYLSAAPLGVLAGPLVGGALTGWFGWQSIFWVQVLATVIIAVATWRLVQEQAPTRRPIDLPGLAAGTLFVLAVNTALLRSNEWGWTSPRVLLLWIVAVVMLVLFVMRERSTPDPAVRLSVFRSGRFVIASVAGAAGWFVILSTNIQLSIYLQAGRSLSALDAALLMAPYALVAFVGFQKGNLLFKRFGAPRSMLGGLIGVCVMTAAAVTFDADTPLWIVVVVGVLRGGAMSILLLGSNVDAVSEFSPADAGIASATVASIRQMGSSLGVAIPAAAFDLAVAATRTPGQAADRASVTGPALFDGVQLAFTTTFAMALLATIVTAFLMARTRRAPKAA